MLITFLFLGLVVFLLFFLIFTPIQLVETHVVSTRMVAVELLGLSEQDMRKREESRMLPGCFPCSTTLDGWDWHNHPGQSVDREAGIVHFRAWGHSNTTGWKRRGSQQEGLRGRSCLRVRGQPRGGGNGGIPEA